MREDEEFNMLNEQFQKQNFHHFDEGEENKFIYTDIFKQYVRSRYVLMSIDLHDVASHFV
jgi:hypothetical protein